MTSTSRGLRVSLWILGALPFVLSLPTYYTFKGWRIAAWCAERHVKILVNPGGGGMAIQGQGSQPQTPEFKTLVGYLKQGVLPPDSPYHGTRLNGIFLGLGTHLYHGETLHPKGSAAEREQMERDIELKRAGKSLP